MKWKLIIIVTSVILISFHKTPVYAESIDTDNVDDVTSEDGVDKALEDVNYDDIQSVIDELVKNPEEVNFGEYVKGIASGDEEFSLSGLLSKVLNELFGELINNKSLLVQLIMIAMLAAIFTNFANVFQSNQVSETAFYVTYIMLFALLTSSFYMATEIARTVLNNLFDFMKVLMPTYLLSIAVSSGAKTSLFYYESTLAVFTGINFILLSVVLPLINIYFVITLANHITKEDMLSKMTELIEMVVQWILKTLLAFVIGFNAIQGLIIPMAEYVKKSAIIKSTSAIPGVGNAINSVTETLLGASVLVKNAIGVTGLIVILILCLVPLVKLVCFVFVYKLGAALVQPVSDKRMVGCISAAANASKLLLSMVFICLLLFVLSIAIIAASTNIGV